MHEQDSEHGLVTWYWEPETFRLLTKESQGKRWAVADDHLGTPTEMFDADGAMVWQTQLDGFGTALVSRGESSDCPWRFPGQYEDDETGHYYNRHRYLHPDQGRYISPDPIGLAGGLRAYAYVDDPMGEVDILGLAKADRSWTRTNTAAGRLPRFSGRRQGFVERSLRDAGFTRDPTNPTHWFHTDGSRVRIDPPHNPARGPARGGFLGDVRIHYHKEWQDPFGNPWNHLDDYGRINADPNRTHIIGRGDHHPAGCT